MEKELLVSKLKEKIGSTNVSDKTISAYVEAVMPTITSDEMVNDTFLASHFSTPALTAFDEHRCVARDERDEPADYLVGLICFMFELVYPASRALAREQGDIHRLLDAPFGITRPFTDPATQATWSRLKDEMRDWLTRA